MDAEVLLRTRSSVRAACQQAVQKIIGEVLHPKPNSKLPYLPYYSYCELDRYLRRRYLPQHLSPEAKQGLVPLFLTVPDNWHTLLDIVTELPTREDQILVILAVAHIKAWRLLRLGAGLLTHESAQL
ncbi:hypothetical protein A2V68_00430 [candidate division Kazan bacterium RBG_13_50_9]|uniref:Uncharacterized protein n=1 Tax=candidate division Kazan bacterium RBG_13_50_9 TaxID=1798535 RepID=A0A1F4NTL0_UNCK3|nr:MAG: hypothetical protein A2V68_00430 [candidate division Kazan bacterium RBG_13_50_9]